MKKLKKILLCFFTFLVSLTMFGCAEVNYNTRLYSNGGIVSSVEINFEQSQIQQKVSPILKEYFRQLDNAYYKNLREKYSNVYNFANLEITDPAKQDIYILQNNPKFTVGDVEFDNTDASHKKIIIQKKFVSIYSYVMYFYPNAFKYNPDKNVIAITDSYKSLIDIPMSGELSEDEGLFINKYIQSCAPFYYNGEEAKFLENASGSLGEKIKAEFKLKDVLTESLSDYGLTEEDVDLIFSFSTPYRRVHSDGKFSEKDGVYTHTFTLGNMHSKVTFWRTYANYTTWYITAAIVGLLVLIVGFIIIKIVLNVKKKKGLKVLRQIEELSRNKEENKD